MYNFLIPILNIVPFQTPVRIKYELSYEFSYCKLLHMHVLNKEKYERYFGLLKAEARLYIDRVFELFE